MHPPCVKLNGLSIPGVNLYQSGGTVWHRDLKHTPGTTSISATILASMTWSSSRLGTTEISTSSNLTPMEEAKWSGLAWLKGHNLTTSRLSSSEASPPTFSGSMIGPSTVVSSEAAIGGSVVVAAE